MINEIADMYSCNNCVFFEVRKRRDLYMWFAKSPQGPSMKCYVQNGTLSRRAARRRPCTAAHVVGAMLDRRSLVHSAHDDGAQHDGQRAQGLAAVAVL